MRSIAALTATAALLTGCQFDLLTVQVESREVCMSELSAEFPAGADGTVTATLTKAGGQTSQDVPDEASLDLPEGFEVIEVRLIGIGLLPADGIDDFGFVDAITLDMATTDPADGLPEVRLVEFMNDSTGTNRDYKNEPHDSLFLEGNTDINLAEYFDAIGLEFTLQVDGAMPEEVWSIDVDTCFSFIAEYQREL